MLNYLLLCLFLLGSWIFFLESILSFVYYFILYFLFYNFSGAHNKPTSDTKYNPTLEHQNNKHYKKLREYEERQFKKKYPYSPNYNVTQPISTIPLTETNISQRSFGLWTQDKTKPVVIRGLIKNSAAVQKWSPDYFRQNYGDTKLLTLKKFQSDKKNAYTSFTEKLDCQYISLSESIKNMTSGDSINESLYINNVTEIFTKHPELIKDLELNSMKLIDNAINEENWLKVNMFMGGPGTGSSLHCAVPGNFFFNIYGEKRWILIDPKYSKYLKSTPSEQFGFVISGYDLENLEQISSINDVIPKLEVVLKPGDVLYIPPWWWHYVHNETDFTIGCAVRDHSVYWQGIKNNPTFMLMSPYIYKLNPLFLWIAEKVKGRKYLLKKSMQSDQYIMHHLSGRKVNE